MSTEIGRDWISRIPSLSDDANIQEAFRMYHYGTQDGSEPAPEDTLDDGIEAHLADLQFQITNLSTGSAQVTDLVDDNDLNSMTTPGSYRRASAPLSDKNYPEPSAGFLHVVATSGNAIYQVYQTIGGSSGTNNYYWRGRDASNAWSSWAQASKVGHNHDSSYYTEPEIDAKISSSITADRAIVSDNTGKLVSSIITAIELGHLSGVDNNIQDQLNDRYEKSETARVFVQETTPSSPQVNDLWIW